MNAEFKENFRMNRGTFDYTFYILERIHGDISIDVLNRGGHTISPRAQLFT